MAEPERTGMYSQRVLENLTRLLCISEQDVHSN